MSNLFKNNLPKIIVVLGPTASGKSELAVKLAKKFNGEIISADSRQVYKGLDIGSGKVPKDLITNCQLLITNKNLKNSYKISKTDYFYKGIEHYLLDVASPKRIFTVAQFQKLGQRIIKTIIKKNKIPIICGGTGLYIDSIIFENQFPAVPPQPKLRKQLEKKSNENLFEQLKKLDPRRAKNIDRHNRRRLIRALEIVITTKKPVPLPATVPALKTSKILIIGIKKSPEELKKMIKKRLYKRLKQGMIEEVKNLRNGKALNPLRTPSPSYGMSWKRLDDLGLEYRYISRYLRGLITQKEMEELILKESWQYAKRQITWFFAKGVKKYKIFWINKEIEAFKLIKTYKNF